MNLCELVAQEAARIHSFPLAKVKVINAVDPRFETNTEEDILRAVISKLLHLVVLNISTGPIKVWAKQFHNLTVIHIQYNDKRQSAEIEKTVAAFEPLAEQMGGCLYVSKLKVTSIAFTFLTSVHDKIQLPCQQVYALPRLLSA